MTHGTITLRSGMWAWSRQVDGLIIFRHAERSGDEMRVFFPSGRLTDDTVTRLARDPDVRIWTDDGGVQWQVSIALFSAGAIAAEMPDFPDQPDHVTLEFDSQDQYCAIEVPITLDLGDITHSELQDLLREAEAQPE